jgi:hypothetical protein
MIVDIEKLKDIIEIEFGEIVVSSHISDSPESAVKGFLSFASERIKKKEPPIKS